MEISNTGQSGVGAGKLAGAKPRAAGRAASSPLAREGEQASERLAAVFGQAVMMLMGSPSYREHSLKDLEWLVVPAIATGQLRLAKAQIKAAGSTAPAGLVMWAKVSGEVDRRLEADIAEPLELQPEDWKSGENVWLVDAVGEPAVVEKMLKQLMEQEWSGAKIKLRARGKDNQISVGVLEKKPATVS